ncbi:hypothetical protein DFJ73DRAFT_567604 [Zopfochytrium polystomum]|nr:hypothetical protein DFJ73DRAFT_567604 [Zopfochytrium polystomum]
MRTKTTAQQHNAAKPVWPPRRSWLRRAAATVAAVAVSVAVALPIPSRAAYSGRMTYYDPSVGYGSCGTVEAATSLIVAMNSPQYSLSDCYKYVCITYNGISVQAKITDQCPGCPFGGLDASPALFDKFADEAVGVFIMSWDYGTCGSSGSGSGSSAGTTTPTSTKEQTTAQATSQATSVAPVPTSTSTVDPTTSSQPQALLSFTTSSSSTSPSSTSSNSATSSTSESRNSTATRIGSTTTSSSSAGLPSEIGTTTTAALPRSTVALDAPVVWPTSYSTYYPLSARTYCSIKYRTDISAAPSATASTTSA